MQKGVSAFCGIRQIRLNNVGPMKESIHQKYGARPLKRALKKYVEDPLPEEMLKGRFSEGNIIRIAFDEAENELRFVDGVAPVPEGEGQVAHRVNLFFISCLFYCLAWERHYFTEWCSSRKAEAVIC